VIALKLFLWNLYPPFVGAGIQILRVDPAWRSMDVRVRLRWWNKNIVGTMFGGAIYSACDPFHMVLLMQRLGPAYVVRDKGAELKFLKKGLGSVTIHFALEEATVQKILACPDEVQEGRFIARPQNEAGEVIAEVVKVLHIRRIKKSAESALLPNT
jgi:hypothetical protein